MESFWQKFWLVSDSKLRSWGRRSLECWVSPHRPRLCDPTPVCWAGVDSAQGDVWASWLVSHIWYLLPGSDPLSSPPRSRSSLIFQCPGYSRSRLGSSEQLSCWVFYSLSRDLDSASRMISGRGLSDLVISSFKKNIKRSGNLLNLQN